MSKVYEFLKDCQTFFVLTSLDDKPYGRPFGAIMELEEDLYIATSNQKQVYMQMILNQNVSLLAKKPDTREWLRVTGIATECTDLTIKQQMLDVCPVLNKHYPSADYEHYNVFKISVITYEFN